MIRYLFDARAVRFGIVLQGFLLVAVYSSASGQNLPGLPRGAEPTQREPSSLARGSYVERQKATLEMWRQRSLSRQAVQDAARDADPEVAERAEWILKQWRSGSVPGVGQVRGDLLLDRGNPSALAAVMEQGAFRAVLVAVEESAGTIEFDQIKDRVARLLVQRYPFYCEKAFEQGTESDLLLLLDSVAIDRSLALARRDLAKHLGLNDVQGLPSASSGWDEAERVILATQFAMLDGQIDASLELAERSGDQVLLRITRMLADRWGDIARDSIANASAATNDEERIESLSWALAAAHRIEDPALIGKASAQLKDRQSGDSEEVRNLRWRSLAIHGDVDDAIEILAAHDRAAAAKVACSASRFMLAAELCDVDLGTLSNDLEQRISDAFDQQSELPGQIAPAIERLYSLARLLVNTGDTENALRIYKRLTPRQIIVSPYGKSLREQTLSELALLNRFDWMLDIAVAPGENAITQRTQLIIARALDTESDSIRTVLDRVKSIHPKSSFRDRFRTTFQLFRGKLPEQFDPEEDFRKLYDALVHHRQVRRRGNGMIQVDTVTLDLEILEMFGRHGEVELAREGLEILSRKGNLDAMIASAESDLDLGNGPASDRRWQQVATKSSEFTPANLHVTLDHGLAYAKSVVGQWILAKRAGHHQIVGELESRIRLMMTSPSLEFRKDLADHLREQEQYELAIEYLRELSVSAAFGGDEAPDFFKTVVSYVGALDEFKESDPAAFRALGIPPLETVRWSDLAVFGILKSAIYYDSAFISVPLSIRKTFLQQAIDTRDKALAEKAIREIEAFDPLNIDYGERMLPGLASAGMPDLAAKALNRLIDHGLDHVDRFPFDATSLNNIAWTAAMNEKRLDEALKLSERSILLEPDSVVFRDTLAEILHLVGRTPEALAIESACLLDEPDDWHLHEQILKYRSELGR